MKKDTFISVFKKYFPYAAIVIASILSCFVYLCNGVAAGDDIGFHLGMVNDLMVALLFITMHIMVQSPTMVRLFLHIYLDGWALLLVMA